MLEIMSLLRQRKNVITNLRVNRKARDNQAHFLEAAMASDILFFFLMGCRLLQSRLQIGGHDTLCWMSRVQ